MSRKLVPSLMMPMKGRLPRICEPTFMETATLTLLLRTLTQLSSQGLPEKGEKEMVFIIESDARKAHLKDLIIDLRASSKKASLRIDDLPLTSYSGHIYEKLYRERENLDLLASALESIVEEWSE